MIFNGWKEKEMILCSMDRKKKGEKMYGKNLIRREKKNCSIYQVTRGKGITFNDFFSTIRSFKNLLGKKCIT